MMSGNIPLDMGMRLLDHLSLLTYLLKFKENGDWIVDVQSHAPDITTRRDFPEFPYFLRSLSASNLFVLSEETIAYLTFENIMEMFSFTAYRQLLQMFLAVTFFHSSEYVLAVTIHGKNSVTLSSLLISKNYVLAMMCSLIEYIIEIYFFPGLKEYWFVSYIGLTMVIVGEIIRKLAIITAGRSFTHLIRRYHDENHVLITHGIYKYVRHPSYCGFLIWSVGTQIMLCNPLATVAFAVVVWRFFQQRIPYEEFFLRQFFGSEYDVYARQTPSGVPFVK